MRPAKQETTEARLDALALPEGGGWLGAAREDALGRLRAVGLPHRRDEYWRYTDPAPLNAPAPQAGGVPGDDALAGVDAFAVEIVDGVPSWDGPVPKASRSPRWPRRAPPTSTGRATSTASSRRRARAPCRAPSP